MSLKFRGSKNQRILDLKKSLKDKRPIEIKKYKIDNKKTGYPKYNKKEKFGKGIFI
jgi:hypothetical protein